MAPLWAHLLLRPWIHITTPSKKVISGVEVRGCLMQTGTFSVSLVDAIMRLWTHLDDRIHSDYEKIGLKYKHWRHFLPAAFSCITICPCLSLPRWSCYFWDFKIKTISVLDPMLMKVEAIKSSIRHEEIVIDLHKALFACKDRFFSGWDVSSTGWSTFYLTDFPPSKFNNTELYAVHYARNFTGDLLANKLKDASESNLSEIRGEILYLLLSMAGNFGYKPQELFTALRQSEFASVSFPVLNSAPLATIFVNVLEF
ncbi:hypothetical protein U9M48_005305 [Paspalum notatum var. saurae]|uniref:Uncharacterized protein n=1 Tax=Paspalum notatum var. saurae TaxID=547442 RepID=A0AAQ3PPX0_PASNO